MRKIFLFLFAAVLSIGTAMAVTITLVDAGEVGAELTLSADEYQVGDEITASASHYDDGYAFAYWKEGETIVSYSADYTFTIEGDRTLEAYFGGSMPVDMANLVVDADAMTITGSNDMEGIATSLVLADYDSDMEMWSVDASSSTISFGGTPLTILYSEVWLDTDAFSMAMARVVADFGGELFVFNLTMTAAADPINVEVETGLSLSFGNLIMSGTWTDEESGEEYPFRAEIGAFDHTTAEAEVFASVELGEWIEDADEQTRWFGFGQGLMTLTIADGVVTLTGSIVTNNPVNTLNVTATGMLEVLTLNLDATVEEMEMDGDTYLHLTAVDEESGMDFDLYLNDYTGADGEYELNEASTAAMGMATVTGSLTKSSNTYTGTLYAEAGTLYIFNMTLTKFVPTYDNINITGLTGQAEARYMGWGDEYYLALSLEGTWSDGVDTYPVLLEITGGYNPTTTSGTMAVSLTIGGWAEEDPWLGNADGELSYTLSGKNITLKGKMENPYGLVPVYWDVTITGTILPADVTLTEDDNKEALAYHGTQVNATVSRNFTANSLYTIALPFTLNSVTEVFGNGSVAYEFAALTKDENSDLVLQFKTTNTLVAGKPYLLEPANTVNGFVAQNVTINNTETPIAKKVDKTTVTMSPVFSALADNDNAYWLAENNWLYNDVTPVKGLRALFTIYTESGIAPRARVALGENETTGIDNIVTGAEVVKTIENGQLIIIRNGEKFNVQGIKL